MDSGGLERRNVEIFTAVGAGARLEPADFLKYARKKKGGGDYYAKNTCVFRGGKYKAADQTGEN